MERRRYKHPPIEEALVEFRFKSDQGWDPTMPGQLHGKLSEAYPGKPRQQNVVEASLVAQQGQGANFAVREGLGKVQLVNHDATRLVGIGHDALSVHMLRPYQSEAENSGWDEFRPRIVAALSAYWDVADPSGVRRIGMRYINKLVVPATDADPARYLKAAPPSVEGIQAPLDGFVGRAEYAYHDDIRLVVSHATVGAPEGSVAFLMDVDLIWLPSEAVDMDAALKKMDELRVRERDVFEALITDDARILFDAS